MYHGVWMLFGFASFYFGYMNFFEEERLINKLRLRQNSRYIADDTFKHIFLNENVKISIKSSHKSIPKCKVNSIPALVQMMA